MRRRRAPPEDGPAPGALRRGHAPVLLAAQNNIVQGIRGGRRRVGRRGRFAPACRKSRAGRHFTHRPRPADVARRRGGSERTSANTQTDDGTVFTRLTLRMRRDCPRHSPHGDCPQGLPRGTISGDCPQDSARDLCGLSPWAPGDCPHNFMRSQFRGTVPKISQVGKGVVAVVAQMGSMPYRIRLANASLLRLDMARKPPTWSITTQLAPSFDPRSRQVAGSRSSKSLAVYHL